MDVHTQPLSWLKTGVYILHGLCEINKHVTCLALILATMRVW